MSETELSVVCKSCGAEVSPYVTECPYCGTRLRKRAPDLERRGESLAPKLSRREKKREEKRRRQAKRRPASSFAVSRPWATIALILVPAVALIVRIATGTVLEDFGGLLTTVDNSWWHFFTAPFAYVSIGYLFVTGLALAVFAPGIERRIGSLPTLLLLVACGVLGVVAGYAIAGATDTFKVIAGGNGIALGAVGAWFALASDEAKAQDDRVDLPAVLVSVAVILLLPVMVPTADFWSGLVGGLVGGLAGLVAARIAHR